MFKSMQPKDWVKLYLHGTLPNTDFDMSIGNFTHTVYKYTNVIACNNERTEKFIKFILIFTTFKYLPLSYLPHLNLYNSEFFY